MAEEFRQKNPFISFAQAFERVGEANPELMQRERAKRYQRNGALMPASISSYGNPANSRCRPKSKKHIIR